MGFLRMSKCIEDLTIGQLVEILNGNLVKKIKGFVNDFRQADADFGKLETSYDWLVYEGWQEKVNGGYQQFLFKMNETPADRVVEGLSAVVRKIQKYVR